VSLAFERQLTARARFHTFVIKLTHADGSVTRANTRFRNVDWDDGTGEGEQKWNGWGSVIDLNLPDQAAAAEVTEYSLSVSGISSDYRWLANESVRGQAITIWLAFLGDDGRVIASELVEAGVQDRVSWNEDENMVNTITLTCRGGLPYLANQEVARWSPEPHAAYLTAAGVDPATDTGFDAQHGIPDDAKAAAWYPPS